MGTAGRFLWMLISVMMMLLAAAFVFSNDSIITLGLWPLTNHLDLPLWLFGIATFIVGATLGALVIWVHTLTIRTKFWFLQSKYDKLSGYLASQTSNKDSDKKVERHNDFQG
jgi:uncharacterized integral membrane protein